MPARKRGRPEKPLSKQKRACFKIYLTAEEKERAVRHAKRMGMSGSRYGRHCLLRPGDALGAAVLETDLRMIACRLRDIGMHLAAPSHEPEAGDGRRLRREIGRVLQALTGELEAVRQLTNPSHTTSSRDKP